jgi:hypothetical protein
MIASDNRRVPSALIPWVFALVALLGCNAMAPNTVAMRKGKYLDGSSVSQVSPEALPAGSISIPLVFLAPGASDGIQSDGPSSLLLGIENGRAQAMVSGRRGEVQGRAPPVEVSC